MCVTNTSPKNGFSLVEVNLAILLVAVGLLTLFTLFPIGLQESELGLEDMHEVMFADSVLNALEANAMSITNWDDPIKPSWRDLGDFKKAVRTNIYLIDKAFDRTASSAAAPFPDPTYMPPSATSEVRSIRYELDIRNGSDPRIKTATLRVYSGKFGNFDRDSHTYFADFVYMGM